MVSVTIQVAPYLAQYARKRWAVTSDGGVIPPKYTQLYYTLVGWLSAKPVGANLPAGNLTVLLAEKDVSKDLRHNVWLSPQALFRIERALRCDFDMTLHDYMDELYYRKGIDYQMSAVAFCERYGLDGLISEEALLKKHVRFKKLRRQNRGVWQTELDLYKK